MYKNKNTRVSDCFEFAVSTRVQTIIIINKKSIFSSFARI